MNPEGFAQMTSPALEDVFGVWHETLLRVRYAETDKMGIVYYANYLVWFEIGRTDYCRARGFSYRDMEESEDAFLVVAEAYCRYKAAAYYDDELIVRAEGETGHVVTDSNGRVRSFPEGYAQRLLAPPIIKPHQGSVVPTETAPE
jgi:acyl-CoA thioester hydrolase